MDYVLHFECRMPTAEKKSLEVRGGMDNWTTTFNLIFNKVLTWTNTDLHNFNSLLFMWYSLHMTN